MILSNSCPSSDSSLFSHFQNSDFCLSYEIVWVTFDIGINIENINIQLLLELEEIYLMPCGWMLWNNIFLYECNSFIGEGDDRGWDGWMASLNRWTESEWTLGVGDGQGGLACCDSWGHKESDTTGRPNWTDWSHLFTFMILAFICSIYYMHAYYAC